MAKIFLTEEQWEIKYKPLKNEITNREEWNGRLYETYGLDDAHVRKMAQEKPTQVWTILTGGNCGDTIVQGFHYVDRFCHFITEVPFSPEDEVEVLLDGSLEFGLEDRDKQNFLDFVQSLDENYFDEGFYEDEFKENAEELLNQYNEAEDKFYPFEELFVYVKENVLNFEQAFSLYLKRNNL